VSRLVGMTTIRTPQQLLRRIGPVIAEPDPLAALEGQGLALSKPLRDRLTAARPIRPVTLKDRERLVPLAKRAGAVEFRVVDGLPPVAPALPEGEWDFMCALRMDVLNEVLVALRAGFEFPREVTDGVAEVFTRARLEALSDDLPSPSATIGPLRITGPLQLRAVPGTERVLVTVPISLVFLAAIPLPPPLGGPKVEVSSLRAQLSFAVGVEPRVEGDELELWLAKFIQNAKPGERVRLVVEPESPIQPRSAAALAAFEDDIDFVFRAGVAAAVFEAAGTVSPVIQLPLGDDEEATLELEVTDVAVRTHAAAAGDVISVGVRLATDAVPEPGTGDRELLRNPFRSTTAGLNAYVKLHEELVRKVIKEAEKSGELQAAAAEVRDDIRVDAADAELRNNELRVLLDIRIVDACFPAVDINARATVSYRFSVFEGRFMVTAETDIDLDNTDVVLCVVTAGLELLLAAAAGSVFGFVVDLLRQIVHFEKLIPDSAGTQDNPFQVISAVFDPKVPIPGTEVLPRVEAVQALISSDKVESLGALSLRPDDVNTYVYAAFQRRSPDPVPRPPTPIAAARVELVDQDFPLAPGDDATPPPTKVETKTAGKFETTTTVTVVPARRNEVIDVGTTDGAGRVKFVLTPADLRTTAGTIITSVVKEEVASGEIVSSGESQRPFLEARPDVFFRVTPKDGPVFDTRLRESGFIVDLSNRRTGSPDAPLTFIVGPGPIVA
jgi:hypothetical protein